MLAGGLAISASEEWFLGVFGNGYSSGDTSSSTVGDTSRFLDDDFFYHDDSSTVFDDSFAGSNSGDDYAGTYSSDDYAGSYSGDDYSSWSYSDDLTGERR